jgi:hypothetical protein
MLLSFLAALSAQATTLTESFDSRANFGSSTALWNQAQGKITPTIILKNWNDGSGAQTGTINMGDGSHGAFNSTTWSQFGSVDSNNKIIYLNTNLYPIFNFTSFTLDANWTIQPVGSNPLIIYVLGNMVVSGIIDCSGVAGTSSTGTSPATTTAGVGGAGRCGGGQGGNGAAIYSSGTSIGTAGTPTTGLMTGGGGGYVTAAIAGAGGGGGGAWTSQTAPVAAATEAGNPVQGDPGAVGANFQDKGWAHFTGSGGGGGGSGSNNEAGGGGGGGGGIIVIHVAGNLNVSANAVIKARGGNGGSSPSTGGEGGGGGGGSIQVWVGGTLSLEDAFNVVQIDARAGTGSASSGGGNGGDGWPGRNWISAMNFPVLSGATYQPVLEINFEGTVEYSTTGTQVAITSGIDTSSTTASFSSAQFLPASASATVEVAGSRDNFQSDDSGYMSLSNISRLNNKRFLRYRISITNSSATTPTVVDSISAT